MSTNSPVCSLSDDRETQLLNSLSSLESRLEFVCNITSLHSANCVKCKTPEAQDSIEIMADSSTSSCFTHMKSDLSEFEVLDNKDLVVKTASKTNSLRITGKGAMILMHKVTHKGKRCSVTTCLYPVYYLPGLLTRLISVGHLLNSGFELGGSSSLLSSVLKSSLVWSKWATGNRNHGLQLPILGQPQLNRLRPVLLGSVASKNWFWPVLTNFLCIFIEFY